MRSAVIFALCGLAGPTFAETLVELRGRIAGSEVMVAGQIGSGLNMMDDEALAFRDADGTTYEVVFDAGREARKALDGCKFALFGGGTPCALTARAEVELDGANLRLIVFEVQAIAAPAPVP